MRGGRRLVLPLLLAAVTVTALTAGPARADDPSGPSSPSASPSPTDGGTDGGTDGSAAELPVTVAVSGLLPRAPRPDEPFEVTGTLTNTGSTPVLGVRVRLQVGEVLTTRSQLTQADSDRPRTFARSGTTARLGAPVPPDTVAPAALDLPAGGHVTFTLLTTTDRLDLGDPGVYPLDVVAVARGGLHVGLAPTWLPWFGGDTSSVRPTRVAVVWPLVDTPVATPRGPLLDDHLAGSLAARGRLAGSLAAARAAESQPCEPLLPGLTASQAVRHTCRPAAPVTYAVDPDLLDTATAMANGYQVQPGDGKAVAGTGTRAAATWLTQLRAAVAASPEQQVVALPYADPDVDALTRTSDGTVDVLNAQALSQSALQSLGLSALDSVALAPPGSLTAPAIQALTPGSTHTLVLDPAGFATPSALRQPQTATAQTLLPSSPTATGLVTDGPLSNLLSGELARTLGPRLAEQRFLAESALLAAEAPSTSRTVVLSPDRRGAVVPGVAAAELQDLGRVPWLCGVALAAVADDAARCDGDADTPTTAVDRGSLLAPPPTPRDRAQLLRSLDKDRDDATQITSAVLVTDAPSQQQDLRKATARAESGAFASDPQGAQQLAGLLHQEAGRLIKTVDISAQNLTLTSDNGTLSVSVENTGSVVVQCRVRFSSPTLSIGFPKAQTSQTELLSIPPRTARQATVRAASATTGRYQVFAQLVDQQGRPFGSRMPILVRSTQYGRLALALTAGAAALLLVASGARLTRRVLRSRRQVPPA